MSGSGCLPTVGKWVEKVCEGETAATLLVDGCRLPITNSTGLQLTLKASLCAFPPDLKRQFYEGEGPLRQRRAVFLPWYCGFRNDFYDSLTQNVTQWPDTGLCYYCLSAVERNGLDRGC